VSILRLRRKATRACEVCRHRIAEQQSGEGFVVRKRRVHMEDLAAAPWGLVTIVGVVILGAILAYGMWKSRRQSPAAERRLDAATKREYQREDDDKPDVHMPT
jgi:hypothetical protein